MSGNLPAYFFHAKNRIHVNSTIKLDRTQVTRHNERQRRMGVEPTRDRAERPPSRFEDGETHRGPYTSICTRIHVAWPYCAIQVLSCQARLRRRSTSTSVSDFTIKSALRT